MNDLQNAAKQTAATQAAAAASLAGGIIAASGRPWTMEEAISVYHDAFFSMFPQPGHGRYDMWKNQFTGSKKYE
ncbi:MAG: hypothetical protein J0I79_14900 [Mesorhizobium sp.]|uniref:hypothetical protein n=1 Tax=Mesorhizobium sp. TaxID=1871066 RepID=UPI001AD27EB3|nr:hypothetical protein [Mesorhizobium sp.]MBN9219238.1 hypothetical protein [Mesorhizobium sp.]